MLVADEVGLGKTIVAKGIIARKLKERMEEGRRTPLRVTYICSNQVIAHENVRKLNLFPSSVHMKQPVSRLAFLARDEEEYVEDGKLRQNLLELNSLTPATSFEVQRSSGLKQERAIIYALLCRDLKMFNRYKGLQWLLRGGVEKMQPYQTYLERMYEREYKSDLPSRYIRQLKREQITQDREQDGLRASGRQEDSLGVRSRRRICGNARRADGADASSRLPGADSPTAPNPDPLLPPLRQCRPLHPRRVSAISRPD